jgi:hypothetical protein
MALAAGTRLGLHEIIAPIGAGGMGEVYKARRAGWYRSMDAPLAGRSDLGAPARQPFGLRTGGGCTLGSAIFLEYLCIDDVGEASAQAA